MCGNGASLICVHNDPIVSLDKPVTLLNGRHKKICTVSSTEAEFLDVIGPKVLRIFQGYSLVTSTSWAKVVLKLVGNVNIVYGNLKSENSKIMDRNLNEIVRSWIRLRFALLHSFPWFTHGNFGPPPCLQKRNSCIFSISPSSSSSFNPQYSFRPSVFLPSLPYTSSFYSSSYSPFFV